MDEKKLLENAKSILKEGYSESTYDSIYKLFTNQTVSEVQRNNAKALLKKDLALRSSISDVMALLSIVLSVGIGTNDAINQIFIGVVVIVYGLVYLFKFYPGIQKETYVLSILEDI